MRRMVLAVALLGAVLVGCGDDGGGSLAVDPGGDGGSMTALLGLVSVEGDNSDVVLLNDFAAAGEAAGLDRPEPGDDEDDQLEWFRLLTFGLEDEPGLGLQWPGLGDTVDPVDEDLWRDELGWAPVDVSATIETAGDGDRYFAFLGEFDAGAIDEAVRDEPVWGDDTETDDHAGVEFYTWGEDDEIDGDRITDLRQLGQGGRMAILDEEAVLWTWATEPLEDGIDAATGEEESLADDEDFARLAEALDDEDAVAAALADGEVVEGAVGAVLEPVEALATGLLIDDGDPGLLLAYVHEDEDAAEENAEALEELLEDGESAVRNIDWSEQFSIDEIEVDGELLVARLDLVEDVGSRLWAEMVYTRENLFGTT